MRGTFAVLLVVACAAGLFAQEPHTIFFVRHAEKVDDAPAALLNADGLARAKCLAQTLRDARISAVYATDVQRTQQTAAPTAAEFSLRTQVIPKNDAHALVAAIRAAHGNVLVVNHADTLPNVVKAFSGEDIVPFGGQEYDRLIEIEVNDGKPLPAVIVHYCPWR